MKHYFFQYTYPYPLVNPSSSGQPKILFNESVSPKDNMNDHDWNKIGKDRLPKKEKSRIYNEIVYKIKELELNK